MDTKQEYIFGLITSYLSGEISETESEFLISWIGEDKENLELFNRMCQSWNLTAQLAIEKNIDPGLEWEKLSHRMSMTGEEMISETPVISVKPSKRLLFRAVAIAAVFIVLIMGAAIVYRTLNPAVQNKELTAVNQMLTGTLPDGTTVNLNKGSLLEYPSRFTGDQRNVKLRGTAYFEVAHDRRHPFVVEAAGVAVEVLGTRFYVSTSSDGSVEVVLIDGKVAVYRCSQPGEKLMLSPGESVLVDRAATDLVKKQDIDPNNLAWNTGKLEFNDRSMDEVAAVLQKTYGQEIVFQNEAIKNCRITATFSNQPLGAVMNVIAHTLDLSVENRKNTIFISGAGCENAEK